MSIRIFQILCLSFLAFAVSGQNEVSGLITDEQGQAMPYTSIYVQATTTGTTSNLDGYYTLSLPAGSYDVVFQHVGYRPKIVNVRVSDNASSAIDVVLVREAFVLQEVVVSADAEDPAYSIIRRAIAKRKYYRDLFDSYSCEVYVKGNNKVLDAPEKILGFDVGDLDGALDSNRQGIVYLSESVSELYFKAPDSYKEIVTSSKISGDDQGYSFNSAREMQFNFYDNSLDLNREIVSPIAGNALNFYRYTLLATFTDESGRLVHKIRVVPKREADPVFYGTIYIVDELWNIHSLELGVTAKSTQLYFVDSLTFRQIYVPLAPPDYWSLFSNSISFKLSGFGFVFAGIFTAVYSDYVLNPAISSDLFDNNVHVVNAESNERDSAFWSRIRPVPLTSEESKDYVRKDSIQKIRTDPAYMDSIDARNNRFTLGNLLGGYNYQRRSKGLYWNIGSPIGAVGFNTVQGFNGDVRLNVRKYFDKDETRRLLLFSNVNYGFSEEKVRVNGTLVYRASRMNGNQLSVAGGTDIIQYNREQPIDRSFNTVYSLFAKKNYAKYFDVRFVEAELIRELADGVRINLGLKWENRRQLVNNSDYSFFARDRDSYTSNLPDNPGAHNGFADHKALMLDLEMRIRFGQKYVVFPDRRFSSGNKGPTIRLHYRGAIGGENYLSYHLLEGIIEDHVTTGVTGDFSYFLNAGWFVSKERLEFMDFKHFLGTQTFFTPEDRYERRFLLLPYYQRSTDGPYLQAHFQHSFDGYILDKIPVLNSLGLGLTAGGRFLGSQDNPSYFEFNLGVNKVGYKIFRLFRVDGVLSLDGGKADWGLRLGIVVN